MNSDTSEMENAAKSVACYLECDYTAAAIICQAAVLNDLAADISRIADSLDALLSEVAKSNLCRKEAA
jgi:hypothetical protein